MGYRPSPTAARLSGVAALFVAFGALLTAESNDLSRRQAGAIALAFGLLMIAVHVVTLRTRAGEGRPSDASLAALAAALSVPPGLIALLWDSGIGNTSSVLIFGFSRDGAGNGLLVSAVVFAVAYALARDARWLLIAPLALVGGIEVHLLGSGAITSFGNGSWKRFVFLLAATAALTALASRVPAAERHNLLLAAAVIVPFTFISYPSGGSSIARDVIGAALLAGLTLVTWQRVTPGIGVATVLMAGFEVASLSEHGRSIGPAVLFAAVGVALLLVGGLLSGPRPSESSAEQPS
jgi:hypothetical protein